MNGYTLAACAVLLVLAGCALAEGLHRWTRAHERSDELLFWYDRGFKEGYDLEPIDIAFCQGFAGTDGEACNRYLNGRRQGWKARMAQLQLRRHDDAAA
jgi:hypothetical protein